MVSFTVVAMNSNADTFLHTYSTLLAAHCIFSMLQMVIFYPKYGLIHCFGLSVAHSLDSVRIEMEGLMQFIIINWWAAWPDDGY